MEPWHEQHHLNPKIRWTAVTIATLTTLPAALLGENLTRILPTLFVGIASYAITHVFKTFNTIIDGETLTIRFETSRPKKTININDIETMHYTGRSVLYGYGIRKVRNGWLWRAGGHQVLALQLRNGKRLEIGSHDPIELSKAIATRQKKYNIQK